MIFIFGFGGSGTNWALNLMDLHPDTHCRNEPNELPGAPLDDLPYSDAGFDPPAHFADEWDAAVEWAAQRFGVRDRAPQAKKSYLYHWPFHTGLWSCCERRRLRPAVGLLSLTSMRTEWQAAWWMGPRGALTNARPVLKIILRHAWAQWVLRERPACKVVHVVRHPAGVLSSWRNRYLARHDPEQVRAESIARLRLVGGADPTWAERFGDLDAMSVDEAEVWFWRYSGESLHTAGETCPSYLPVVYENLVSKPASELRRVYEFCELPWSPDVEARITPTADGSNTKPWHKKIRSDPATASRWRDDLTLEDRRMVERVVEGSCLMSWW